MEMTKDASETSTEEPIARNALQDNIKRKGQNAYYYAHASSRETVKNYGGEPQRLDGTPPSSDLPVKKRKNKIARYSWLDGKKTVRIFVPMTDICAIDDLSDESVSLDWTPTSLVIGLNNIDGKDYELNLAALHDEIRKVSHKKKGDDLVVTMFKQTEISWYQLVKK